MAQDNKEGLNKQSTTGVGIRTKLLFWLLIIALVPMAIIGAVSYKSSSTALEKQSLSSLETTRNLQKQGLKDYFSQRNKNLVEINGTVQILQQQIYSRLASIRDLKKRELLEFLEQHLKLARIFSSSPQQKNAYPLFANPSTTAQDKKRFVRFYNKWMGNHEFSSLILVDKNGRVLYSNDKLIKAGLALNNKKGTPEYTAFKKGLQKATFSDFAASPLRKNAVSAYYSAPLKIDNVVKAAFLLRLTGKTLDDVLKGDSGLGENGDIYLVGHDRLFRSNSIYFDENVQVNPAYLVDTESVDFALQDKSGTRSIIDFRGEYVYSAYMPVTFSAVNWALMVEIDQAKAMELKLTGSDKNYFATFLDNYELTDLYLVSPDGFIFYSETQEADYQTNILTGPYADSGLGEVVGKSLETGGFAVSDVKKYVPSNDLPASFMALPIMQDKEVALIVAIQLSVDPVDAIMRNFTGRSTTGDAYIVGGDKLFRSNSLHSDRYGVKSTILNTSVKVDSVSVQQALSGQSGTGITTNAAGTSVLASWAPFSFKGLHWALVNEINKDEVFAPINKLLMLLLTIAGVALVGVVLLSLFVSGGITKQIDAIMNVIQDVEGGDLDVEAKVVSKDELGTMASAFNNMISTTRNLVTERQEEHDQLQESIMGLLMEISDMAEGDLTVRATVHEDVTGTVADSLNMMLEELGVAIGNIKESSEQVGLTANALSSSTEELAEKSDNQAELISKAQAEINQITHAIEEAAAKANKSAETSELSRTAATEGTRAVEDTSQSMEAIRSNVQDTARAIKRLGESSQEISDFAKTINEISDRTSILALNASIQASAAGEEGRGFAVVAEEIQRLAERAAGSTRQIETLIKNILGEITDAGASMDSSIQEVVKGAKLSEDALAKLQDINKRSSEVANFITDVSTATGEQAASSVRIAKTMEIIGEISTNNATETRETSSSMRDMSLVAAEMLESVSTFKLTHNEDGSPKQVETKEDEALEVDETDILAEDSLAELLID